ncbi:MAG: PmoA family protein [Planctomycetes bacterium]|nr:PmoA family protein [Planctomycetota bacterium]
MRPAAPLEIDRDDQAGLVTVRAGDHVIVGWQFADRYAIPHWFPLRSPSGKDLLDQHPDPYGHHRAMWIADKVQLEGGPVVDFYHCFKNRIDADDPSKGHRHFIRQGAMPRCKVVDDRATIETWLEWIVDKTQPVLDDVRTLFVRSLGNGEALLDLSWTLRASHGAVTFHSDWIHYAWPYLRIHPRFSVAQGGRIVDDWGRIDQQATNAQYANWIDYSNTVDGVTEGVAMFVPQDGSWRRWLTRDYGTFGPRRDDALSGTGFVLAKGEALRGSARILVHRGDAESGAVATRYRDYVRESRR